MQGFDQGFVVNAVSFPCFRPMAAISPCGERMPTRLLRDSRRYYPNRRNSGMYVLVLFRTFRSLWWLFAILWLSYHGCNDISTPCRLHNADLGILGAHGTDGDQSEASHTTCMYLNIQSSVFVYSTHSVSAGTGACACDCLPIHPSILGTQLSKCPSTAMQANKGRQALSNPSLGETVLIAPPSRDHEERALVCMSMQHNPVARQGPGHAQRLLCALRRW
jgi:hypothetical protein